MKNTIDGILDEVVSDCDQDHRVDIEWIGEGNEGDYDPTDSEDVPLLRFDVSKRNADGEWEQVQDGSYCTLLSATLPIETIQKAATYILRQLHGVSHIKKICEKLSWISAQDLED